ncbi:MAG: 2-hydroxyacyl-CoA dehydratase family protein [Candidatus Thermoplasmatota archaeon]|nr:2-hydroxyacyl-CoA dehydratase family protein [Candidatus Thermoplasmatota archaeon]
MKKEDRPARYIKERKGYFSEAQVDRTKKESKKMSQRIRKEMSSKKVRAKAMSYFDDVMEYGGPRVAELEKFKKGGGKVVGTMCVMVPSELTYAAGARSIRLCSGYYECVHPANELLGDAGLCPMVKSTLGSEMVGANPITDLVDLVVTPATCDGKMKLAEILEDWVDVHIMNLPRVKTGDTTSKTWLAEIEFLKSRLEALTGRSIGKKDIIEQIELYNSAQEVYRDLLEHRKGRRVSITGQDAMLVAQASQMDDVRRWTKKVRELVLELDMMEREGRFVGEEGGARILLAGSPMIYPNFKIPSIVEDSGGTIITDELCTGIRLMSDPIVLESRTMRGVMEAIAEKYFYPCSCPCFTPNDERINRIKMSIKAFGAEGVVFHSLRGCHLNNLEATKIELELKSAGIPMLKLESEYDEGDVEQVRTRVEAFVEMLRARR